MPKNINEFEVTIMLAHYNGAKFLDNQINSLSEQIIPPKVSLAPFMNFVRE